MIRYKIYQSKRKGATEGLFFARVATAETYDLDQLAAHMASHNSPYSKGVIRGVLTDMVTCIKELVLDGKQVKLPDLALFSVGLKTSGATEAVKFTVANNVKGFRLRVRATGELRPSEFKSEVQLKEALVYDGGGETTAP